MFYKEELGMKNLTTPKAILFGLGLAAILAVLSVGVFFVGVIQ